MVAPVVVSAQTTAAPQPAKAPAKKLVVTPKKKVVVKKEATAPATQPKVNAVQDPGTDRKDQKVATFIDQNVNKAMEAKGEKTPVPDAPAVPADGSTTPPGPSPPIGVLKTSTTANEPLVEKALENKGEDKKLMGAAQIKNATQSAPKNVTKPAATKVDMAAEFEKAFVDVDEDQDESNKPPSTEEKLQTDGDDKKDSSAQDKEKQKLMTSISKIESHLAKAKAALANHKNIENNINSLATAQHGLAKKELMMSVKRQEDSISELQKHIEKGEEQLALKKVELKAIQGSEVESSDFEIKAAVKKEPKAAAEAAKKEAVTEFKKAEAQVEKNAEKLTEKALAEGIDIKSLTEKNNKLWEQKYNDTLKQYEKEMSETENKYKKELEDKSLVFQ